MLVRTGLLPTALAAVATFAVTTTSYAGPVPVYDSIQWTGADNFNSASMTWTTGFYADKLVDITGNGNFEAVTQPKVNHKEPLTNFYMYGLIGDSWVEEWTWSSNNTSEQSLAKLVPPVVSLLNPGILNGLMFTSNPLNTTHDYTFSAFLSKQDYYNLNEYYYDSRGGWDYYEGCGDYENYLKNVTTFKFEDDGNSVLGGGGSTVPLPAALPLFASGLGIMGLLARRRKRKLAA